MAGQGVLGQLARADREVGLSLGDAFPQGLQVGSQPGGTKKEVGKPTDSVITPGNPSVWGLARAMLEMAGEPGNVRWVIPKTAGAGTAMEIVGNGIYSYAECARLIGISRPRVRAWFQGWRNTGALLHSDYEGVFALEEPVVSFLDLVDVAVAITLNSRHGVSIQTIRKLRERLSNDWSTQHPFAREEFYTDDSGRRIFCSLARNEGEPGLLEILKRQFAIPQVLLPFLRRVEYNEVTKLAQRFRLTDRVVLDPRRKYGKPIVVGTGMPTSILYQCFLEVDSEEVVADWYNVTAEDVVAAVRFETEFSGIAA